MNNFLLLYSLLLVQEWWIWGRQGNVREIFPCIYTEKKKCEKNRFTLKLRTNIKCLLVFLVIGLGCMKIILCGSMKIILCVGMKIILCGGMLI